MLPAPEVLMRLFRGRSRHGGKSSRPVRTLSRLCCALAPLMEVMESRTLLAAAPPTLWTTQGPGGGGSYFSAAVNGSDLWVASDMSGIYHSGNFGQTWQQTNFHTLNGGTASQVSFTSDPNTLYIPNSNLGVAKTTNGGATWSKLAGWTNGEAFWMAADPTSTTKVLVANVNNLYVSTNGGTSFTSAYASSGLFVAGALFDGSSVYVGTNKGLLVSTNGGTSFSLASAQLPAGQFMISFAGAKQGTTTRLLAVSSATNPSAGQSANSLTYGGLYRLDVGGTWTDKSAAVASVAAGETPHFVGMARGDTSIAYLGGADGAGRPQVLKTTNGGDNFADVFFTRTVDGGGVPNKNTITSYSGQGGDFDWSWGGAPWSFVVSSSDANRAMLVNSGFIDVTSDGGATWHQADVNPVDENPAGQPTPKHKAYHTAGADDTSVHYLVWTSPTNVFAGYTDTIGWRSTDGGQSWAAPTWNGVADNTVYDAQLATDGKFYAAASNVHDMYESTHLVDTSTNPSWQNGRVIVSADQGATWSLIHEFGHPVVWAQLDPNNANRMYAMVVDGAGSADSGSAGGVWVTSNLNLGSSSTWTKLPNPPRTEGHPYVLRVLNDGTLVATYSGRRALVGGTEKFTDSSGVFVSADGGATWIDRSAANMHWYTKEITIDPTDATQNTWYAAVANGWSGTGNDLGDVYRTTNRGVSWTKMNLQTVVGAISLSTNSVAINPTTKEMYVATETRGVLYAPDVTVANFSSANFSDLTSFPFGSVERVFVNPNDARDVWAATFGGGMKRGGVGPSAPNATPAGAGQINLSWSDNSANESGFAIDRATDANFTQNVVTTSVPASVTTAAITGLTGGTTYYFRVRATSPLAAAPSANSSTASATASTATTTVSSAQHDYNVSPNELNFTFAADVGAGAFSTASLTVVTVPGGATVTPSGYSYDSATRTGRWSLPASLADGNYRATLHAGTVLSADYVFDFFVLAGDANHDRSVDLTDFATLAANFNGQNRTFSQGDFDYDRTVDLTDFTILATSFNKTLAAAATMTTVSASAKLLAPGPPTLALFKTARSHRDTDDLLIAI